jgi:Mrp family chromosome partitioning ATPase
MSKHFELMQQLEQESRVGPKPVAHSVSYSQGNKAFSGNVSGKNFEEVSRLIQQIFFSQTQPAPQVVVIASVDESPGSGDICVLVAETLAAQTSKSVCLVETSTRTPGLPLNVTPDLKEILPGLLPEKEPFANQAVRLNDNDLWFSPSQRFTDRSGGLLPLASLKESFSELRNEFEFVIVHAAPLSIYTDGMILGQISDGLVMVIEANATRRKAVSAVTDSLRGMQVPILAAILNNRTFPIPKAIYDRL